MIRHQIYGNNKSWLLNLNLIYETLWTGAGSGLLISILEKLSLFRLTGQTTLVLNSSFKMLGLFFSSKLDWGSYIISIAKTAPKKIGTLIRSMKFVSPEVALYLYKSTIRSCMEYCCHVCAGASSCYLLMLDQLQKRICRTAGPALPVSLKALAEDVYVNSFFSRTARLWNSLPIECFCLTYNLNGFKPRINRNLLSVGSF